MPVVLIKCCGIETAGCFETGSRNITHTHTHRWRWNYTKNYRTASFKKNFMKISQQVPTMATRTHLLHIARAPQSPCPLPLSPPVALLPFGPQAPSLALVCLPFLSGHLQQPSALQALFLRLDGKENLMPLKRLAL